jgi:DNA-binding MarR family transcriptional regulator
VGKVQDEDQLAAEWHETMGRFRRLVCTLDRELESKHGISASDFEVLQLLTEAPEGKLKMHELGEHAHLTQSALSRLVARLEGVGMIERCMCADDRRSVFATITAAGRERYAQARPTQRAILRAEAAQVI